MKEITLTQNLVAYVDDEVYQELSKYKWCAHKSRNKFYADRGVAYKIGNKWKVKGVKMHRFVYELIHNISLLTNQQIDHLDGNGLNNTIENLRIATPTQNCINKQCKRSITGYRGVYKECNKFKAQIQYNKKSYYLGLFNTPEEAAYAYDSAYRNFEGNELQCNFKSPLGWCFITC
jgi:hypothetical protein